MTKQTEEDYIQVLGKLQKVFYKGNKLDSHCKVYTVFTIDVIEVLAGNPKYIQSQYSQTLIKCCGQTDFGSEEPFPYNITAKKTYNEKYGDQYEIISMNRKVDFKNYYNQEKFLSMILTKTQVDALFNAFSDPISVLESRDIKKLITVKGIKQKTADKLIRKYENSQDKSILVYELVQYGLTENLINRIIGYYGDSLSVIDKIKSNPYQMIGKVDGVGFKKADEIAIKMGYDGLHPNRVSAYVQYFLESEAEDRGNSYVSAVYLKDSVHDFFAEFEYESVTEVLSSVMKRLISEEIVVIDDNENKSLRKVYLKSVYNLELEISNELKRLMSVKGPSFNSMHQINIDQFERDNNISFSEKQLDGIKLGLSNQVCLITGLAGTGKSSLVAGILAALGSSSFVQCALSGKAAARLQEVTHSPGQTIHRLLEYKNGVFTKNENNQLKTSMVILDEVSLVGGELFLSLLKAIKTGTKLIMLGDLGQLESIGKLNIAYDMSTSGIIPTVNLTQIFRQSADSGIIAVAHAIRRQEQLFSSVQEGVFHYGNKKDMHLYVTFDRQKIIDGAIKLYQQWYDSDIVKRNPYNIQAIAPVKELGLSCVKELNRRIQEILNPVQPDEDVIYINKDEFIHVNDKIMCVKNTYKALTEKDDEVDIFNGWVGQVKYIDESLVGIQFQLCSGIVVMTREDVVNSIVLGYASTVHKLQGSDVPVVIGVIDYSTPPQMLTNSLLYTLLTRAKTSCSLLCENGAFRKAVGINNVSNKHTFLRELLNN